MNKELQIQIEDSSITILQGDLLEETVDAIVNPTNSIIFSYGLCTDIYQKAGQGLRLATKAIGSLKSTEAKMTLGFHLPAAHIIHTCAPVAQPRQVTASEAALAQCYRNCLQVAEENQLRSIAFPCISTRLRGFDRDRAACIVLKTIINYLKTAQFLKKVRLVCRSAFDYEAYQTQLDHAAIAPLLASHTSIADTPSETDSPRIPAIAHRLLTQIAAPYRIAAIGSTQFWDLTSEAICRETGRYLAQTLAENFPKAGKIAFLTGGVSGIPETIARSFWQNWPQQTENAPVFHIQPKGFAPWDFGETLVGGVNFRERRQVLGCLAQVYLVIEGGPGTEQEACIAKDCGAIVIPLGRSGGVAEKLYQEMRRPAAIPEKFWQLLGDRTASPKKVGYTLAAIATQQLKALNN